MDKQEYQERVKTITPKVRSSVTFIRAFFTGGLICVIGQAFYNMFYRMGLPHLIANNYTTLTLIAASVLLTGFGLVSPIVRFAGAGYLVPITGFANSVASCAIEFKREGQVFGIGSQIFAIAGPVILYGTITSALFGALYYVIVQIG